MVVQVAARWSMTEITPSSIDGAGGGIAALISLYELLQA
jgi:hypothetical protein